MKPEKRVSHALSFALRHGATKMKLSMDAGGWVSLAELLQHKNFRHVDASMVQKVVAEDTKGRFEMKEDGDGVSLIRATQGHTLSCVTDETLLTEIGLRDAPETAVHGTSYEAWQKIQAEGLKCMGRNHIHLAPGLNSESGVISGMRKSSTVFIYVDVKRAMHNGVQFYRSSNNVILTRGLATSGTIPVEYFSRISIDGTENGTCQDLQVPR